MPRLAGLLTLILVALLASRAAADTPEPPRTVSVKGEGKIAVAPDLAMISIGVETEARNAADAMRGNAKAMTELSDVLFQAGIEPRDIQTTQLSLNPRLDGYSSGRRQQVVGYVAANVVQVRVRDLASLGPVLDKVAGVGANRINGLSFGLADRSAALIEARKAAMEDAIARATLYAESAGAVLGPVLSIEEYSGAGRPMPMARAEMAFETSSVPVAEGEMTVAVSVSARFALQE